MIDEASLLLPGERIDDLQFKALRIIQSPDAFRFGMDAVLLADFARVKNGMRVCDLGTGTGILPLLLSGRADGLHCDAVEIQPDGKTTLSVRLIDTVGYMIPGAVGADEDGQPRMVTTPWLSFKEGSHERT